MYRRIVIEKKSESSRQVRMPKINTIINKKADVHDRSNMLQKALTSKLAGDQTKQLCMVPQSTCSQTAMIMPL